MDEKASFDLQRLKTYSIGERTNLVEAAAFVEPDEPPGDLLRGIPDILAGSRLKTLCRAVAEAHRNKRTVVMAMGAHVIKCGLSLLVIDLMERGILTAVAFNGAGAVHDWEMARIGATSEDVAESLEDGSFGMCRETPEALSSAAAQAAAEGRGFGEVLGRTIEASRFAHKRYSIFAAAHRLGLPATVHVCLGCDTVHMHAGADGAAIGAASMTDFRRLAEVTASLEGGVWLNVGSSVVLPEVFLKTLSMARNLTGKPVTFTAADLDMIRHYRPQQNVVTRPGGVGLALTGHHEILVPLLRWGVLQELGRGSREGMA